MKRERNNRILYSTSKEFATKQIDRIEILI